MWFGCYCKSNHCKNKQFLNYSRINIYIKDYVEKYGSNMFLWYVPLIHYPKRNVMSTKFSQKNPKFKVVIGSYRWTKKWFVYSN